MNTNKLKIRRYNSEDNDVVKELHFAGIQQIYESSPSVKRPDLPYMDADLDDIENVYFNNGGDFLVGQEENEIVAIGAISKCSENCGEIKRIRVRRDKQAKGYATVMMENLIEQAKILRYNVLTLNTMIGNIKAQKLFEKLGFERISRGSYCNLEVYHYRKELD